MGTPKFLPPLILALVYMNIANSNSITLTPPISSALSPAPATSPHPYAPRSPVYPGEPASPSYPGVPSISPAYDSRTPVAPPSPATSSPSAGPAPNSYPPGASPAPSPSNPTIIRTKAIKAAYWASFDGFEASLIDTSYFTHIYYAFLLIEPTTFNLSVTTFDQEKIPEFINSLRTQNPPVKTLLSVGGAGCDPNIFAQMVSTEQSRAIFINSTIEIARIYGFDGLDLDWEFPANKQEMYNLALLFQQWREALDYESRITGNKRLLLSSAVYYSSQLTSNGEVRSYPVDAINSFVDWINPMCYDYYGSWENFTGPPSALYDPNSALSTSFGINSWIQAGVLPWKLVLGLPLYGRTWTLQNPDVNGFGAPALGVGPGGGILGYNQILDFNSENKAIVHFGGDVVSYYSYAGNSWVGYDDTVSVDLKIRFAKKSGLGGYFFWALGQDYNWTISRLASTAWGNQ